MKKMLKRSICLLAVLCIIAGLVPMKAQAYEKKGEYKIHSISEGKWVTTSDDDDYTNVYKFKIPSDGYIKVKVNSDKCTGRFHTKACAVIFTTYKVNSETREEYVIGSFLNGENYVAVKAGTYYFYSTHDNLKFKYEHTSVSHGSNYCMQKAKSLTSGKNYREVFAYGYEYTKWYKITLHKRQKIKTFARRMESQAPYGEIEGPGISLYLVNQYGVRIKTTTLNARQVITGTLPKGTYYICLTRKIPRSMNEYRGDRLISMTIKKQ